MAHKPKVAIAADFTNTPEFAAAVTAAVDVASTRLLKTLTDKRAELGNNVSLTSDDGMLRKLALAIAEVSDQGTHRKRVAPEILVAREEAQGEMVAAIIAARAAGLVPLYQLRHKVYLDEIFVDPIYIDPATKSQKQTEIEWPGIPNHAMIPVNEVAQEIYALFEASVGSVKLSKDEGPMRVTPGGLVVRGAPSATRHDAIREAPQTGAQVQSGEGLSIRHKANQTKAPDIAVLGTIARKAQTTAPRQNA